MADNILRLRKDAHEQFALVQTSILNVIVVLGACPTFRSVAFRTMCRIAAIMVTTLPAYADFRGGREAFNEGDFVRAQSEYLTAAESGDANAQNNLAHMFRAGQGGPVDLTKALYWFTKAANSGQLNAETSLGDMYEKGDGTPQNFILAKKWYSKAAIAGFFIAQSSLAGMLENGEGGPKDPVAAEAWYTIAARHPVQSSNAYSIDEAPLAAERRDRLRKQLSPAQASQALLLADGWRIGSNLGLQGAPSAPVAVQLTGTASEQLVQIQSGCDLAPFNKTFAKEVKCIEARATESSALSAQSAAGELKLYVLTADNLVDLVARKSITSAAARVQLQNAFLNFRERLGRQEAELRARESSIAEESRRAQAELRAQQASEERRRQAAEENRRATAQMIEAAQTREFEQRRTELIELCVATAKLRIRSNPLYVNDHYFQGIHPDTSCAADPYWYKTIPSLQSQVGAPVYQ